jgi:predicted nucleic acid-binding protein
MPGFGRLPRVYLILDANAVIRELRFRVRRRNPKARSTLDEVLHSTLAVAFAPPTLVEEVEEHLDEQAAQMKIAPAILRAEWQSFRLSFALCPVTPVDTDTTRRLSARDPDDLPYVYLCDNLSAEGILTADKDLRETGARVVDAAVLVDLRDYGRSKSIVLTFQFGGVAGIVAVAHALMAAGRFVVRSALGFFLVLGAGVMLWLLHAKTKSKPGGSVFTRAMEALGDLLRRAALIVYKHHWRSQLKWKKVTAAIGGRRRRTLRQYIFAVLAVARRALTVAEIIRRVLAEGHRSRAKNLRGQVRRCLRSDPRLALFAAGRMLSAAIGG